MQNGKAVASKPTNLSGFDSQLGHQRRKQQS